MSVHEHDTDRNPSFQQMIRILQESIGMLLDGERDLREKLAEVQSDEERASLKAQCETLARQVRHMRWLLVREVVMPLLVILAIALFATFQIQQGAR